MNELFAAKASNAFGFELTRAVAAQYPGENLFLSPLSVFLALAMTANGGMPETRRAMLTGMQLPDDLARSNAVCAELLQVLHQAEPKVTLELANALWAFAPHRFDPQVVQRCQAAFQAELRQVTAQNAATKINGWAAEKTHNMVREIVRDRDFAGREQTVFALSNATYFKGIWATTFDAAKTQPLPFSRTDGTTRTVPMMRGSVPVSMGMTPEFMAVRLPYSSGRFALYGFLPALGKTPESLLPQLGAFWSTRLATLRPLTSEVIFPKLTLDLPRLDLVPTLGKMQLLGKNDVTPLERPGPGSLFIKHAFHKTRLEVDEEGTRAAAVTVVVVKSRGFGQRPIVFNRPFVLCLADQQSGAVLFTGIVHDPVA